jgi:hypothetical protein
MQEAPQPPVLSPSSRQLGCEGLAAAVSLGIIFSQNCFWGRERKNPQPPGWCYDDIQGNDMESGKPISPR